MLYASFSQRWLYARYILIQQCSSKENDVIFYLKQYKYYTLYFYQTPAQV